MTKGVKTRNGGTWTESQYISFIKSALRKGSTKWAQKYICLNEACIGQQINPRTGRLAKHYRCNKCGDSFPHKEVEVNHKEPIVPVTGWDSWDGLIERLFCEKEGLEVLCKPCHKEQSKLENTLRKVNNEPTV